VEIYLQIIFRRSIIHGSGVTTYSFSEQTAATLEFYFRFRFWRLLHHWHIILHRPIKFHAKRTIGGGDMTWQRFSRWRSSAMLDLLQGNGKPTYILQLRVSASSSNFDLIGFIVSEILRFGRCGLKNWNSLFTWLFPTRIRRISGKCTSEVESNQIYWSADCRSQIAIFNIQLPKAYLSCSYKGRLLDGPLCWGHFWAEAVPTKIAPKFPFYFFWEMASKCKISFSGPPKHIFVRNDHAFW